METSLKINKRMKNIIIIIGTKAQYIKMMPIMKIFINENIPYILIDTGQHAKITKEIRSSFDLKGVDLHLSKEKDDVTNLMQAFFWNIKIILKGMFESRKFINKGDFCLVHGDTLSTLQGTIIAKTCGGKVVHVEAGERTNKILSPFPEEIIRRVVDKFSDICFASSDNSFHNLNSEKTKGEVFNLGNNTVFDAVSVVLQSFQCKKEKENYVLVSIHRAETIYSKERMKVLVSTVNEISQKNKVIWGIHEVTRKCLDKFGLLEKLLNNANIEVHSLFNYSRFISLISGAEFLVTDGGGPQEESFLLNTPCLLMRMETERDYYENVYLSEFDNMKIDDFIQNYKKYKLKINSAESIESPSKIIVRTLCERI